MKVTLSTDACLLLLQGLQSMERPDGPKLNPALRMDMALNIGKLTHIKMAFDRTHNALVCQHSEGSAQDGQFVAPGKAMAFAADIAALADQRHALELHPLPHAAASEVPLVILGALMPILADGPPASEETEIVALASKPNGKDAEAAAH